MKNRNPSTFNAHAKSPLNLVMACVCLTLALFTAWRFLYSTSDRALIAGLSIFGFSGFLLFVDAQTRVYSFDGKYLFIRHFVIPYTKKINIAHIQHIKYFTGAVPEVLFKLDPGWSLKVPLLGTISELIAKINSVRPLVVKE